MDPIIEKRLAKLESKIRLLMLCCTALGTVLIVGWTSYPSWQDNLRTKQLTVTDESGKSRIILRADGAHAGLSFFDGLSAEARVLLGITPTAAGLWLTDSKGKLRADIANTKSGSGLSFYDAEQTERIRVIEEGFAAVGLQDRRGRPRILMMYAPEEGQLMSFMNEDGKVIYSLPRTGGSQQRK